jgi:hypothetical protein
MFMPSLSVNVVVPFMMTGADGLLMTIPPHVSVAPSVLVQLAGNVTVESQMALSPVPGALPLTQLAPTSRLSSLLAFVWFAFVLDAPTKMAQTMHNE